MKAICKIFFSIIFICITLISSVAQIPINRVFDVNVVNEGLLLSKAWCGGINVPIFFEVDCDLDGLEDLIMIENVEGITFVYPYIAENVLSNIEYKYSPEFSTLFQFVDAWATTGDFNGDGLKDVFTFQKIEGSINYTLSVYKAVVDDSNAINYELFQEQLGYYDEEGLFEVWKFNANQLPVIEDVDNDGDLDILMLDPLGKFLNQFQNLSKENSIENDGFEFVLNDYCWGKFTIADASAQISLNINCDSFYLAPDKKWNELTSERGAHGAATFTLLDVDNDDDKDVLIGVLEDKHLRFLENGGTNTNAFMENVQLDFPPNTTPAENFRLSKAYKADIDKNGLVDIIVAPSLVANSYNVQNIWYYKNIGSTEEAEFEFQTNAFLQDEMIDVGSKSFPVLFDYNNDGLTDLFIGNQSCFANFDEGAKAKMTLYENIGTENMPVFELVDSDFSDLSRFNLQGIYPAFGDLDGDGDIDMVAGNSTRNLYFFENASGNNSEMNFDSEPQIIFQNSIVGELSPILYDYNDDQLLDIVLGTDRGSLYLLERLADTLAFEQVSDFWGGITVQKPGTFYGFSVPEIFVESDQEYLVVKSSKGYAYLYEDLSSDKFTLVDSLSLLNDGILGGISLADLNNDGSNEWVLGNVKGGLTLYSNSQLTTGLNVNQLNLNEKNGIFIYPNPAPDSWITIHTPFYNNDKVLVSIFDIAGKEIYNSIQTTGANGQMPINTFIDKKGCYFVRTTDLKTKQSYSYKCLFQ